jgi:hypothetical protein
VKEQGQRREGKVGTVLQYEKQLMAIVNVSLLQPFNYAKFRYFFKVMLTKHAQNE